MHGTGTASSTPALVESPLRRLLLWLVLVGALGLLAELALLEHYEDPWQFAPLVLLAIVVVATTVALRRPRAHLLRAFRALMALCLAAGALGVWLHYQGNVEFAREQDASLRGIAMLWEALRGATPELAPGALAQLGLLGLIYTYHHPALARGDAILIQESTR